MKLNFEAYITKKSIPFFLLIALTLRILISIYYGDRDLSEGSAHEWGVLFNNLKYHGDLYWFFDGNYKYPSLFMPPLYPYFIYLIDLLPANNLIFKLISVQILISLISSLYIYKICEKNFNKNISLLSFLIFSFYPANLYSSSQISSITIVMFLYIFFLYVLVNNKNLILLGVIGGFGILARGEFFLIFIISLIYLFFLKKINIVKTLLIMLIALVITSPYLIRNYIIFNKLVITQSTGYVLWRGNNSLSTVDSIIADREIGKVLNINLPENYNFKNNEIKEIYDQIKKIKYNPKHDLLRDKIFFEKAVDNIKNDPFRYFTLSIKKFFSFTFINLNSNYPNYYNIFSILPEFILSIGAVLGIILNIKNIVKLKFIYFYTFYILAVYSCLLILPRYKLILLPTYSIFFSLFINYILHKFIKKKI